MSSIACIKWIKIGSPSFKPTLIVGLLLASSQVNIASLIFLALDLVIGPSGTCKGSLKLGPLWFPSYGEHPKGGMTEIESCDIDFIETDFPSIGNANRDLDLYELEEDEGTLPSSSEGGGLVPHPVIAEDSGSDLQPSDSITLDQDSQAH